MANTTFAQRLNQACDDSSLIPEYGKGRQVTISNRLKVTQEAVRKWFAGESLPRPDKMRKLAEFLEVEESWLALGVKPEMDRNEKRANRRVVEGAVHMITGLIMIEGGNCAFPGEKDPRAGFVDIYAIMRGTQIAIHVSAAHEVSSGRYEFIIPREYADVRCVGFVPMGVGRFHLIDLPLKLVEEHKTRKSGDFAITVNRIDNKYYTGQDEWPRFKAFGEIL